jgi:hypothetical protein
MTPLTANTTAKKPTSQVSTIRPVSSRGCAATLLLNGNMFDPQGLKK